MENKNVDGIDLILNQRIYSFEDYANEILIWDDLGLIKLEYEDCYSNWFKKEIMKFKTSAIDFFTTGLHKEDIDRKFLLKLISFLSSHEKLDNAIFFTNGYPGRLGLEYAKGQLRILRNKLGRLPTQRDSEIGGIDKALRKYRYWTIYGIRKWNDLMYDTFGEVNHSYKLYNGIKGIKKAKTQMIEYWREKKKKPTARDFPEIVNSIYRELWIDLGIRKWNDLMKNVFNEVNKEDNIYTGKEGLKIAEKVITDFHRRRRRKPTSIDKEIAGIYAGIKRKYWINFGIKTWNDLLFRIFGGVNKEYRIWMGIKGLERAINTLLDFYDEFGRKPVRRDKGMAGIEKACRRGYWEDYSISNWSELLKRVFNQEVME